MTVSIAQVPFDPEALRAELPLFALGERAYSEHERAYLRHYGIDFAATMPSIGHEFGVLDGAYRLAVHRWHPPAPRATVFVLHGYFDHIGLYRHLIRDLLERRFAVVGLDMPGHGLSSGDPAHIDSFDEYVDAFACCRAALMPAVRGPWHIVGQSTGAAVAMEWVLANGYTKASAPFTGLALLAPLVRPANWRVVRIAYHLGRHFVRERERLFRANTDDVEFLRFLREADPLQAQKMPIAWVAAMVDWMRHFMQHPPTDVPALVIQGEQDTTVDWRFNVPVVERLFDARVVYFEQGRHHVVNQAAPLRERIFTLLAEYLDVSEQHARPDRPVDGAQLP
jgi:alpha-beta hydrolase superfamily lysophospholipase